mmetsp:Transcript_21042/g.58515  ORF Transcript_21042/g.58515 Transcript_21042/m.58515 type:complete len:352 (+) Transcript_21042:107-1162(+)
MACSGRLKENCLVVTAIVISEETASRGGCFFFLLFLFNNLFGGGTSGITTTTARSGELGRILEVFLVLVGLVEGVSSELDCDREDHLEGIDNRVGDGSLGRVSSGQRDGGQDGKSLAELCGENIVGDLQDLGVEEGSVVIDGLEDHTVREGADVELLQEGGLRSGDLLSSGDQVGIGNHLNLSTGNLGGNLQGLEKGGLTGITSGRSLGDNDISGGNGSDLGRGRAGVGLQDFLDGTKVTIGEDESNVSTALVDELSGRAIGVLLAEFLDTLSHHGVLSHQDLGLSTEGSARVLKLLGTNIVDFDNEALRVSVQEILELFEVSGLAFGGERHVDYCSGLKKRKKASGAEIS